MACPLQAAAHIKMIVCKVISGPASFSVPHHSLRGTTPRLAAFNPQLQRCWWLQCSQLTPSPGISKPKLCAALRAAPTRAARSPKPLAVPQMVMIVLAACADDNAKLQAVALALLMTYIWWTMLSSVRGQGVGGWGPPRVGGGGEGAATTHLRQNMVACDLQQTRRTPRYMQLAAYRQVGRACPALRTHTSALMDGITIPHLFALQAAYYGDAALHAWVGLLSGITCTTYILVSSRTPSPNPVMMACVTHPSTQSVNVVRNRTRARVFCRS
jgi:hypothetical protein